MPTLHLQNSPCDDLPSSGRALLASVSPYFQAVFSGDFKESRDGEVLLKDMDPGILHSLLTYLYSGELALRPESAEDVFTAASRLQLMPALALASRYHERSGSSACCIHGSAPAFRL